MRRSHRVHVTASVGEGGKNHHSDVVAIQQPLNEHLLTPFAPLTVDGRCGPRTIAVIVGWQHRVLALPRPDGHIDPHGPTLRTLNAAEQRHRLTPATSGPRRPGTPRTRPAQPSPPPRPSPRASAPARPAHPLHHGRGHVPPTT